MQINERVFHKSRRIYGTVIRTDKYGFIVEWDGQDQELYKNSTKQVIRAENQERLVV